MKCAQCGKSADTLDQVFLNADGDVACGPTCAAAWRRDKDYFLNVVIHDDGLMDRWWKGENRPSRNKR